MCQKGANMIIWQLNENITSKVKIGTCMRVDLTNSQLKKNKKIKITFM